MPTQGQKQWSTRFYQEDIVQRVTDPSSVGVVLRCWHDSDDMQASPATADPLLRPLKRGEVGVSFFPNNYREILPESEFNLVDRFFQPGDVCKRNIHDVQSGVVASVDVKFKVAHVISGEQVEGWKTVQDVKSFLDVSVGDYVECDDWIGQVQEVFDESIVEVSDGQLVRVPELSAHLTVGDRGKDILPSQGVPQGILGFLLGQAQPSANDTVVAVKHTVLAVAWMAINQSLTPEEASKRHRPQRFWYGADLERLTLIRSLSGAVVRIGDKLTLKNPPQGVVTKHGKENAPGGCVEVDMFLVTHTQSIANVIWQDGKMEGNPSTALIPYLNPDEYDCWPGEHVVWKNEDQKQAAVVQSVNAQERTASILLDNGKIELVSVLELDPHGGDGSVGNGQEAYGVRRSDHVFIHKEGTTNGCARPIVPSIGELEPWVHEHIVDDNGEIGGWRKELENIGHGIAHARGKESISDGQVRTSVTARTLNWFGEVSHLRLDGTVEVALPNGTTAVVPLERLTHLIEGIEQLEDMWGDELSDGHAYDEGSDVVEVQMEDGQWQHYDAEEDDGDWVEEEEEELNTDEEMDVDDEETAQPDVAIGKEVNGDAKRMTPTPAARVEPVTDASSSPSGERTVSTNGTETAADDSESNDEEARERFTILPSAPVDHAFYSSTPSQPSRTFLTRMQKEYRALSSSLPESVIVRAYEDRADLLRCLIIGPENTPYEDAPFVIDWMLDGDFPQSPPIAHFLSWTNGNGRVNPNLYEEGKVCLSILGTWAGDRNESWSAARSSLLQAFVSIQGLVLVKEPWFCEPAYEKWRGTEEGKVNSRLYSEKAYVLSRGFVRRALEIPLGGGFDEVIKDIYYTKDRLRQLVERSRALIDKSKAAKEDEDVDVDGDAAVPRLTPGGIIMLTRTMDKLEALLAAQEQSQGSNS